MNSLIWIDYVDNDAYNYIVYYMGIEQDEKFGSREDAVAFVLKDAEEKNISPQYYKIERVETIRFK